MTGAAKHLVLGLSLDAAGHHPAAWRQQGFRPEAVTDAAHFIAQARLAEEARLDFLLAGYPVRSSALAGPGFSQSVGLEPLSLIAALTPHVRRIGLAAQVPMAYWEPFNVARAFSALDNLSAGRSAWLAVPASGPDDKANFPRFAQQAIDLPYERAGEFAGLVRALWDSWEEDALQFDKANAVFTNRAKVHRVAHKGKYFTCDGPLNAPRPPQGAPPILVNDLSSQGLAFANAHADLFLARESSRAAATVLRAQLGVPLMLVDLHIILGGSDAEARARAAALGEQAVPPADAGLSFVGTAASLAELMADWFSKGACDGFNLLPAVLSHDLPIFVADAAPLLRAKGLLRTAYEGTTLRDHLGLKRPDGRRILGVA
jgi:alkanesulfonate monooxygenase SsuD/methylene tetrahydromethanopterin reductase-like flavin-dependent oxidoreductase (luciferase family)